MGTLASLVVRVGADINGFVSDMNRATTLSKRDSAKILRSFKVMGAGIGVAFVGAANEAMKFEKAMDEVSTLVGNTTDMDALTNSVRAMSREFGSAPVNQAKALYQIISAGASNASDQVDLLTASNKLALGGVTDVAIAADALTTILNAYGMEASQASDVSDLLFVGMKQGKTTIEEMGVSVGKVATIAAQTGVPLNELIAAVATLTKSGIGTSEAMTAVQGVLSAVLKQSKKSTDAADELGVAFNLQALEAKGLAKFLDDIQVAANGDAEVLQRLFGRVEGLTAVMALGADGASEFNAILGATADRAGETDIAVAKMTDGAQFQLNKFKNSIVLVAEAFGARLLPGINIVAGALADALEPVQSFADRLDTASAAAQSMGDLLRSGGSADEFTAAVNRSEKALATLQVQTGDTTAKLQTAIEKYGESSSVVYSLRNELDFLWQQQKVLNKGISAGNEVIEEANELQEISVTATRKNVEATMTLVEYQEKLKNEYNGLIGEYFPLIAAAERYEETHASLNKLLEANVISESQHADALAQAATEYENAQYSAQGLDTELQEIVVTAKRMPTTVKSAAKQINTAMTGVASVIENSFKRLDNTFQSFWTNLLKNGKFSLKGIKDLFLDTIAQMLHAAITQPIVLRIGAAMTGGLVSGAASAAGGSLATGAAGLSGGSIFSNIGSLFSGGQIGQMFASAPGMLGNFLGGGADMGMANWQFGLAGLLGAIGGQALFGGKGGLGGGAGAIIGMASGGPIGALIGGLIGGALGGLFKDRPPQIFGSGRTGRRDPDGDVTNKGLNASALGGFYLGGGRGGVGEFRLEAIDALQQFDEAIASFLSDNQLDQVTTALESWFIQLDKEAVTIENLLESRFDVILSTFSESAQAYVNSFDGLEAQSEALQRYVIALNTLGSAIALFADSNPAETLALELEEAARTSTDRLRGMTDSLLDMFDTFDGTPEQMDQIAQLINARYQGEIEYLMAVNDLVKTIAQSIADQQTAIRNAIDGTEASQAQTFVEQWKEIRELFDTISSAGSPEELAAIVSQIQSMVSTAFGGLDAAGQVRQGQMLIDFLDRVQTESIARAEALAQMVIDEGEILREQAVLFADAISAPLDLNVQATDAVNDSINRQTDIIAGGNDISQEQLDAILAAIRAGNELARARP